MSWIPDPPCVQPAGACAYGWVCIDVCVAVGLLAAAGSGTTRRRIIAGERRREKGRGEHGMTGSIGEILSGHALYTQAHYTLANGVTRATLVTTQPAEGASGKGVVAGDEQRYWIRLFTNDARAGNYGPKTREELLRFLVLHGIPAESGWILGEAPPQPQPPAEGT